MMDELSLTIIGTGVSILGLIYAMFRNLKSDIQNFRNENKLEISQIKFDIKELDKKMNDMDKRLYAIETLLHLKDCCILKQDNSLKKAE